MIELLLIVAGPTAWFISKNPRWMFLWVVAVVYFFVSGLLMAMGVL